MSSNGDQIEQRADQRYWKGYSLPKVVDTLFSRSDRDAHALMHGIHAGMIKNSGQASAEELRRADEAIARTEKWIAENGVEARQARAAAKAVKEAAEATPAPVTDAPSEVTVPDFVPEVMPENAPVSPAVGMTVPAAAGELAARRTLTVLHLT